MLFIGGKYFVFQLNDLLLARGRRVSGLVICSRISHEILLHPVFLQPRLSGLIPKISSSAISFAKASKQPGRSRLEMVGEREKDFTKHSGESQKVTRRADVPPGVHEILDSSGSQIN